MNIKALIGDYTGTVHMFEYHCYTLTSVSSQLRASINVRRGGSCDLPSDIVLTGTLLITRLLLLLFLTNMNYCRWEGDEVDSKRIHAKHSTPYS